MQMTSALLVALVFLTVPLPTRAGEFAVSKASPARVLASVRIGRSGGCSGTIIKRAGDSAWGISAAHCATRVGDQFTIGNPDGTEAAARWIAVDPAVDLSLFITWSKDVLAAAHVCGDAAPDWSKQLEAIGYPGGRGPKWKRFRYLRTEGHGEAGSRRHFVGRYLFRNLGPGVFAGGDSGGGVFYDGDALVGVMTHGGPHAASLPQIRRFLSSHRTLFKGVDPFGSPYCENGECRRPGWSPSPNIPILPERPGDKDRTAAIRKLQQQIDALKKTVAELQLKPGPIGKPGRDGRGITSAEIDGRGDLVIEFTDGTRTVAGRVVGRDGKPGIVSIEFTENGKPLKRISGIQSGSLVRQPIERISREK